MKIARKERLKDGSGGDRVDRGELRNGKRGGDHPIY